VTKDVHALRDPRHALSAANRLDDAIARHRRSILIDELLHGTNSHDRLVGASGIVRALLARGAIGLITTHDLALTVIADELAPRAANIHFEDFFEGGEIRFDYRVKLGPVTRSNALALIRAVGLEFEPDV
jgi:DNA mismatch repair ATPase MutS